jgi:hypothetical protein
MQTFIPAIHDSENNDATMQRIPLIRIKKLPVDLSQLKKYSLFVGLLIGCFIQFSTLSANYIAIAVWGDVTSYQQNVLFFSLLWSFFISALALVILVILRNLVMTMCYSSREHEDENDAMENLILHVECRFIVGALVGVCMAWTVTDLALGMTAQIIYSVGTLAIALVWCRGIMWYYST